MESLCAIQDNYLSNINKILVNVKKTSKARLTANYIKVRIENLEKYWKTFTDTHNEILKIATSEQIKSHNYFIEDIFSRGEENYIFTKCDLFDILENIQPQHEVNQSHNNNSNNDIKCQDVKLPKISIPQFSGNYNEWSSFQDLYLSLVHSNTALSNIQKMHYLKTSLCGEAEHLLKYIPITDKNYDVAWNTLKERYNNRRVIVNTIFHRLLMQKKLTIATAGGIKDLLDTTIECLNNLKNNDVDIDNWDPILIHIIVNKLDQDTHKEWEEELKSLPVQNLPKWNTFQDFLGGKFRVLEMIHPIQTRERERVYVKQSLSKKSFNSIIKEKSSYFICHMCSGQHYTNQCEQFKNLSPEKRSEYIQKQGLCFNCLSANHSVKNCKIPSSCRKCGRRHHTLLHFERDSIIDSTATELSSSEKSSAEVEKLKTQQELKVVAHLATEGKQSKVILATAMMKIKSLNGNSRIVRVLIDQGSEASFISEATVQSLLLKKTAVNGFVSGIGDCQSRTKNIVSFVMESLQNPEFSCTVEAFVLKRLTSCIPTRKTCIFNWPEIKEISLADPSFGIPGIIDIILGVDVYGEILLEGILKHPQEPGLVVQNTQLGWILSGKIKDKINTEESGRIISMHIKKTDDQLLKEFWEIEREPDSINKKMTKEEIRCEEIYTKTTTRDNEGRYIVRLPFKSSNPECLYNQSKEIALKRFKLLENKFRNNTTLYEEYKSVIEDYIEQKHMIQITDEEQLKDSFVVYLPHHAVIKNDRETTKVRVVFDASCKGTNNVSLNDNLLVGPKLQQDLRHILMRWRCHKICIVSDLVKMYRQIGVNDKDTDFQRIVWRSQQDDTIHHYRLVRLTFGTSCAPYLAVKSLQQLDKDEQKKYPIAAQITLQDYYMDDLLTGCDNLEQAIEIYEQMKKLMQEGGFELQKWCTNNNELMKYIKEENQGSNQSMIFKSGDSVKILGISWNKISDQFEYHFNLPNKNEMSQEVTKRNVLSEIARLYDPLGWITPKIVTAKIFIQKLWKSKLSWDEKLSTLLLKEWLVFKSDLQNITNIVIPRWLQTRSDDHVELHAFADASQSAYAAAVYLKLRNIDGNIIVNLVTAKSKVAPVEKEISIPRMELCAALLATKLIFEVSQIMNISKNNLYAWSDSTVVLAWIAGEPSRWTTFVSNRVSEILTMLDKAQWGHVSTYQNPADVASRGLSIQELIQHNLWWHGPNWLQENNYHVKEFCTYDTIEETKPVKGTTITVIEKEPFIWTRFSSLPRMLRVLAYCKKFLNLKQPKDQQKILNKSLNTEEIDAILQYCTKETQKLYFREDFNRLLSKQSVSKGSRLHNLYPILDENGILRVGGRIHKAQIKYDKRHPIILPSDSHITKLIINDAHLKTLHGGPQLMLNFIRSKYWIIRARYMVKKCYRNCIICLRYSQQNNNQLMGQLPETRLTPIRAFKISGVDFTGHINIKFSPGRGAKCYKGYICLFICLFSKAIHLEAVSDLTTKGFIAAYRRFISRRGHCQTLYSDNGTNFIGADKELRDMFNRSISQLPNEFRYLLANEGTTWKFIPPHAPNFGGLWEAGVRSAKKHLKRVIGDNKLTFEELTTVLTQIEACLNSRPLSYLSDSPDDPMPLTPGHFLIGEPLLVIPDEICEETIISDLKRWKFCQKLMSDFWRKWSHEYLVTMNQRYKWTTKQSEPEIGEIVIIKDINTPPAKWWLGKIVEKHSGKDNITRVVSIKTKNGICKRPCNKLCFLPKTT